MRLKKRQYYESLDINKINNNTFWKITSPLFSNKSYSTNSRITLLENGEILREESKAADTFNKFFNNVVKELIIEKDDNLLTDVIEETDRVLKAIKKYKNHPSFVRIKSSCKYSFDTSQDSQVELCIIAPVLTECYNQNIKNSAFPNELKNADISSVYNKKDCHDKSNYRPVSTLPHLSKLFECILYKKIDNHTKYILSKYQGGFRKNSAPNIHY